MKLKSSSVCGFVLISVSVGHDASIFQPAALELSVTLPSCEDMKHMEHWTDLHKTFLQLKEMKNK